MKKVLIVTYYWPPSGGAGVQRWLKFAKYLPENGWQPVLIVPDNPNYPSIDTSLQLDIPKEAQIYKFPIWEPYDLYRKFLGLPKEHYVTHPLSMPGAKSNWKQNLALWFKCNIFIPDPRIFWYFGCRAKVVKVMKEERIDTMITTSTPNSVHLFGLYLKNKLPNIKWLADFRDPWTEIYFERSLPYTFFSKSINKILERKVLQRADIVTTVSASLVNSLKNKCPFTNIVEITNGYDGSDVSESVRQLSYSEKFTISYIGTLYDLYNIPTVWVAIAELIRENKELESNLNVEIAGSVSKEVLDSFSELGIAHIVNYRGYVPHDRIPDILRRSHAFLLTTPRENNQGILTGKVFEYMGTLKPILCITDIGNDLSNMIHRTGSGVVINFEDKQSIKEHILKLYSSFQSHDIKRSLTKDIEAYSRENLTKRLVNHLNKISL